MAMVAHYGSNLAYIIPGFLFVLTIVVFFHELGHFLVGRWCGVQVDAFSLGFGPEIAAFVDRQGTRWRVAAIPLGGYVKFHGDANATSAQTDDSAVAAMPADERATTFAAQSVGKRAAIVAAGPIANFILAIVIYTGTFYVEGRPILLPRVDTVRADSVAAKAGFQPGDIVVAIDGNPIESFEDMRRVVSTSSDVPLDFQLKRNDVLVDVQATPERQDVKGPFGTTRVGVLGVTASQNPADFRVKRLSLPEAVAEAGHETWFTIAQTGHYIGGLFMGRETTAQLSGPIRIAEVSGEVAKLGIGALLGLAGLLSISIGLVNLVPVPLLDGGHLMYFAYEAIRGRPMSEKVQEMGFRVGLALVSMLMIFATYNDVARLFHG